MKISQDSLLLRIFIGEKDKYLGRPLYESIVMRARELHLAGATVIRGILGFGADSRLHASKLLELSQNLPIIIEIVDSQENIDKILPFIDEHVAEGIVTMEKVNVLRYRHG